MDILLEHPKKEAYDVPILLVCYNRPQYISQQIQELKRIRPTKIFIACDGPKNKIDEQKVAKVRECYLESIDWDCEIQTRFSATNQGCFLGVKNAMDWFFALNEEGIIIEDDIIPTEDFFYFIEVMLKTYRDNKRIFSISGCNLGYNIDTSIFASKIMNMWGWATWANRYAEVDFSISSWQDKKNKRLFLFKKLRSHWLDYDKGWIDHWSSIFDKAVNNVHFSTWDYQMIYNQIEAGQLTIFPGKNLIHNMGFDQDATHTTSEAHPAKGLNTYPLEWPLGVPIRLRENSHFYETFIKEKWSFYKRPNWKYFLGKLIRT